MGRPRHDADRRRRGTARRDGRERLPLPAARIRIGRATERSTAWTSLQPAPDITGASATRCTGAASRSRAASSSASTSDTPDVFARDGGGRQRAAHRHPALRALHAVPGTPAYERLQRRGACCTRTGTTTTRSTRSSARSGWRRRNSTPVSSAPTRHVHPGIHRRRTSAARHAAISFVGNLAYRRYMSRLERDRQRIYHPAAAHYRCASRSSNPGSVRKPGEPYPQGWRMEPLWAAALAALTPATGGPRLLRRQAGGHPARP